MQTAEPVPTALEISNPERNLKTSYWGGPVSGEETRRDEIIERLAAALRHASITTDRDRQRAEAAIRELDQLGLLAQSSRTQNVAGALRHPVVVGATLAVLSGILASLVIPALTRVWQDRPRELELKRGLIENISQPVTDAVIRTRYFQHDVGFDWNKDRRRAFFTNTNRRWRIDSALVDAQLATYYTNSALPASWRRYVDAVTSYFTYATSAGSPRWRDSLMTVHGSRPSLVDFFRHTRFTPGSKAEKSRAEFIAEEDLKKDDISHEIVLISDLLLAKRDQLASEVVDSEASGFSHGFWIFD
jgi:hypothetical protein